MWVRVDRAIRCGVKEPNAFGFGIDGTSKGVESAEIRGEILGEGNSERRDEAR